MYTVRLCQETYIRQVVPCLEVLYGGQGLSTQGEEAGGTEHSSNWPRVSNICWLVFASRMGYTCASWTGYILCVLCLCMAVRSAKSRLLLRGGDGDSWWCDGGGLSLPGGVVDPPSWVFFKGKLGAGIHFCHQFPCGMAVGKNRIFMPFYWKTDGQLDFKSRLHSCWVLRRSSFMGMTTFLCFKKPPIFWVETKLAHWEPS